MTKEEKKEYDKKRYKDNAKLLKQRSKEYYAENKDRIKERDKKYHSDNKEKRNSKSKEWRNANKEKLKLQRRKNYKLRRKNDSLFKLKENIKRLIRQSFKAKSHNKTNRSVEILGCSFNEFKIHIESLFEPWMNWNNYGVFNNSQKTWQIDHIIPIALGITKEEIIKLNHYTNLRPLCSKENLDKRDKLM
jgi:hypothetical protein